MKKLLFLGVAVAIMGTMIAAMWPLPNALLQPQNKAPTQILDRNGELLYEVRHSDFGAQNRLTFQEIPQKIINALIATEDRNFYDNAGISVKGVVRAAFHNWQAGKVIEGGSTITQQLVRNRLRPKNRGYAYKLYEMYLAMRLSAIMSKQEILTDYLNTAYFGGRAYGIQAASKTFFDKSVHELSLAESALLVGLLQAPSDYNPHTNLSYAKNRQNSVLNAMKETRAIHQNEYEEAIEERVRIAKNIVSIRAPHFVMWLIQQKTEQIKSAEKIFTTLDISLQNTIERIIDVQLEKLKDKNVTSAAVVVLDANTGELLAMVGSADYFDDENDGAVNVTVANRQPGSTLKPFTYALALEQGDTAATTVADIETQFFTQDGNPYIPRNYDYGYHGLARYREALANSYNIAAVRVLQKVGITKLLNFLQRSGISTLNQAPEYYGVALTLGAGEVKLLELTKAYGIFARGGKTLNIKTLLKDPEQNTPQVISPQIAWLISDILSDNVARIPEFGQDSPLNFNFPVAAKTGTTRNSRDNWVMGYTPDRIVGVWVGNADNTPMRDTSGVTGAGPIFHEVMLATMQNIQPKAFIMPEGIIQKPICKISGLKPTPLCPHTMYEWFLMGTEPSVEDTVYRQIAIDTRNNLLAGENCESEMIIKTVFAVFPAELQKWARENGWPEPPKMYSPLCPIAENLQEKWLQITKPHNGDNFQLDPMIPDENEKIVFEAGANDAVNEITWKVDGAIIGTAKAPDFRMEWKPVEGAHTVSANSTDSNTEIRFNVNKK